MFFKHELDGTIDRAQFILLWFYGVSSIVGYLMPNTVFRYIITIWFLNTFCKYTQLNDPTVLFQTIQFNMHQQS